MRVYLDTSIRVALLTDDPLTVRADAFFRSASPVPVVSDFAVAEFASALGRRVRMGEFEAQRATAAFADLDTWIAQGAERIGLGSQDFAVATGFLRRLDVTLRAPDALHAALCVRAASPLATFDVKMAVAARALDLEVVPA